MMRVYLDNLPAGQLVAAFMFGNGDTALVGDSGQMDRMDNVSRWALYNAVLAGLDALPGKASPARQAAAAGGVVVQMLDLRDRKVERMQSRA